MRRIDLKTAIETVADAAENMFKNKGRLSPFYFIFTTDTDGKDALGILPAPHPDKDVSVMIVRDLLKLIGAEFYVFVDEAWMVEGGNEVPDDISNHPDRFEVILLTAEDNHQQLIAHRVIIRDNGKSHLGPLRWITEVDDTGSLEGRLIGLMPTEETEH